jgi:predicted naringenin-chalcone synthase
MDVLLEPPSHGNGGTVAPRLVGLATATPVGCSSQSELADVAIRCVGLPERRAAAVRELFQRAGVRRRGSVLLEADEASAAGVGRFYGLGGTQADQRPRTSARMAAYAEHAPLLAERAAVAALADAGVDAKGVDQLVLVTCTGFGAPGVDLQLVNRLGLRRGVGRTQVGFMGCHGAINGLRVASSYAASGQLVLLVCVELCTLHFQYVDDPKRLVPAALFADGAAAAVLAAGDPPLDPPALSHPASSHENHVPRVAGCGSCVLPGTGDWMTWDIGDEGFDMTLSAKVPAEVGQRIRPWLSHWLAGHGLIIEQIGGWAVHPGGPRVLTAAAEGLSLSAEQMAASRGVLADHGNMSSPTVLFIVQRLMRERAALPWVVLAFGPGLSIEAALLT